MLEIYIIKEKMRVYKSPVQLKPSNMQKKSTISFVKNVAAPKHIKSQNIYNQNAYHTQGSVSQNNINIVKNMSRSPSMDRYNNGDEKYLHLIIRKQTKNKKGLINSNSSRNIKSPVINNDKFSKNQTKIQFPYNSQTEIRNLISFIHQQVENNLVYVKSPDIYIDYILGLKDFKIKRLVELLIDEQHNENQNRNNPSLNHRSSSLVQLEIDCCQYEQIEDNNYLKNFQIIKCVGSGGFSKVFLVRGFGKLMAMKIINKEYIISHDKANIINNEKNILTICSDHPFITQLHASFETKHFLIFVMEFCNGGELFNLLRKVRRMKQEQAKFYFVQTLTAIAHLHKKGIVYRDIKPENIIIDHQGHLRLADYGLSKIMEEFREGKTYSFCGSAEYMAPQMLLKKGHSYQIDFYCLGALLYQLVIGLPPYYSRNQNELFSNIIHNDLQFPQHVTLSDQLKHFLEHLLQKQVENRYKTMQQILNDPWMKNIRLQNVIDMRLKPPFPTDMFGYNFDDSDFAQQQKQMNKKLIEQKSYQTFDDMRFPDFFYESKEIMDIKNVIQKAKQQKYFMRSSSNQIGEFTADTYIQRTISNSGSIIINKHSREPSINRLEHSTMLTSSNHIPISRRIDIQSPQKYNQSVHVSQVLYYPNTKGTLNFVRSLEHINTSSKPILNRSQQRINSINKVQNTGNIYTTHKQHFHPFGVKTSSNSSLILGNNHQKTISYIRQPNYYSVQKSSNRSEGTRLDIQNLSIKNHRNYSMQKIKDIYSSSHINNSANSHTYINNSISSHMNNQRIYNAPNNNTNNLSLKHATSAHELKKSYLDGFRDRLAPSKVKKTSFKTGEKISISMLNNLHYRN